MEAKECISILRKENGKIIGFSESERQGTESSAMLEKDGTISSSLKGKSPQGEQDTLLAGQILINVLNRSGDNWSQPERVGDDDVADCVAYDLDNPKKIIEIQVVRVVIEQKFWKKLSTKGEVNKKGKPLLFESDIKTSIEMKASEAKIPSSYRKNIVLALDATRLAGHTFRPVVNQFCDNFSEYAKSLGFHSIWIVGLWEVLTFRLDLNPSNNSTENLEQINKGKSANEPSKFKV